MKAVILAAGNGSRMNGSASTEHKALKHLLSMPVIERGILALREAGIRELIVVVGHAAEQLPNALGDGSRLGVTIEYVHNEDWQDGNGTSLYAARHLVGDEPFVVAMADHWYEPAVARLLLEGSFRSSRLCVDGTLDSPHDPSDATKVKVDSDGVIRQLGKDLAEFNGLDCGLFVFTSDVFRELETGFATGEYSLGAAANRLAARGMLAAVDIGDLKWEDVDTPGALRTARAKLCSSLAGHDNGIVSRFLNRRLSLPLSLLAIRARLTPNVVSLVSFLMAVGAGVAFSFGYLIAGAIATQVSSIVDGSDGEVARARFMATSRGGVLDSILDRVGDVFILGGAGYYLLQGTRQPWETLIVIAAIGVAPMSMMIKDRFQLASGKRWKSEADDGTARLLIAGRDGRLFVIFLGGLFGVLLPAMAFLAVTGSALLVWRMAIAWRQLGPSAVADRLPESALASTPAVADRLLSAATVTPGASRPAAVRLESPQPAASPLQE